MKSKNIYTVRLINTEVVSSFTKEKVGKPTWLCLLQKDVSWSAYAVIPDFNETDHFDLRRLRQHIISGIFFSISLLKTGKIAISVTKVEWKPHSGQTKHH